MTNTDLFDPTTPPTEPTAEDYQSYVFDKYGEEVSPQIAKAMYHKDMHIDQLHREQAGVRQELQTRMKMEELYDKMNSLIQTDPSNDSTQTDHEQFTQKPALTTEDVQRLMDLRDHANRRNRNLLDVADVLRDKLGPNYPEKVRQQIKHLGMDEAKANEMAAESPQAFYRLLGLDQTQRETFQSPPRSQVNSEGFRPSGASTKDWNYYENIRKTKPNEYWSPRIQNEIFQLTLQGKLDPNQ